MKSFAALPLLAAIGYAQIATLTSTDLFGETIATSTAEYTPGEYFMVDINLGINQWSLKELKLSTGTYGVEECYFMMPKGYHGHSRRMEKVGMFPDVCAWPNFQSTNFYLNVENIPQFQQVNSVAIKCKSQDVSFTSVSRDLACSGD